MLSTEQTLNYLRKAKLGDNSAKEILLSNNVLLIKSIIRRFLNKGVEYDDLYQIACIGFLKAIANFNEEFETRFSTYAVPMIIGEIKRFMRDDGAIKVSRIIKSQAIQINRYIEKFSTEKGKKPTINEISNELNLTPEEISLALESTKQPISLFERSDDGNEKSVELVERIANDYQEDNLIDRIMLKTMIGNLSDREKKLIVLRFYGDKTQSEIAKALGVSQVQISRLETKIINKFKNMV